MGIACPLAFLFLFLLSFGVLALHSVNQRPTRQFTIRGMMLFIFLWAVCLSQISLFGHERPSGTVVWRQDWIVLFAWIVLAVFYGAARQFAALLLHSAGVLFCVCSFAFGFIDGGGGSWTELGCWMWGSMIAGSFLSLIFFSLMMLLTILRRPLSPPRNESNQP
jgi:hypothetical protein